MTARHDLALYTPPPVGLVPQTFDFAGFTLRAVMHEGQVWFIAQDVCGVLTLGNVTATLRRLDADEKGFITILSSAGPFEVAAVTESGLYTLILTSRKPEARTFRRWVTGEVIPSIRATGSYGQAPALPDFSNPAAAARAWADEYEGKQLALAQVAELAPKAEVYDQLLDATGLKLLDEVAKELGWVPQKFRDQLYADRVLMHRAQHGEHRHNLPYTEHMNAGRFEVKPRTWKDRDGQEHTTRTTYMTAKGLLWAAKRYPTPNSTRLRRAQ